MNRLEEIKEYIEKFVYEKTQVQQQIAEIEERRAQLAKERNEKKAYASSTCKAEIDVLAKQISELGNQSQGLQSKLDAKFYEVKSELDLRVNSFIAEGIRKIRMMDEEKHDLEDEITSQQEKNARYEMQKQEFYERFGRFPELSENAEREHKIQEVQLAINTVRVKEVEDEIENAEIEITELARIKREFRNKNWASIVGTTEEFHVEEFEVEDMEPIEQLQVEEFCSIEDKQENQVREFKMFGIEDNAEEFEEAWTTPDWAEAVNQKAVDPIEELAKAIVEEIVAEQTKDLNINQIEERKEDKEKVNNPEISFWERPILSNIIVKFEEGELVYNAQASNGDEIKVYPSQIGILEKEREAKEIVKEILLNYAISKNKILDKKAINKVDAIVCELLAQFAIKYDYNVQNLIYNYSMSFSRNNVSEAELVPEITYNISCIEGTKLTQKEKDIMNKVCKNAKKNKRIDIIGAVRGLAKIKYVLKRIFGINKINALPEGKY